MRKTSKSPGEKIVNDIKRATRKQYSAEGIQRNLGSCFYVDHFWDRFWDRFRQKSARRLSPVVRMPIS